MTEPNQREREARVLRFPTLRPPLDLPFAAESEAACSQCGGPWGDLGHCKGVCMRCGYMQSCVDVL